MKNIVNRALWAKKRVLLAVSFWLLALGFVNAQEAFYIYRNDGDFNGFFYDEVLEMRQSKIGVDSVEYDRWVTQEVVLADTIYRIPLGAIDSIGFQQPEIIINPDVRHMDLLGMTPYVTSRDDQTLTFSNELPSSLMPQEGNVLFGMEGIFQAENFGGRVTSVRNEGSSIIVETDKLTKMSDIFVQFITVEEVGFSEDDPTQLRRRMAGMNKIKNWDGSYSLNTLNVNINLQIPINAGGKVSGSINAGVYLKCRMVVTYQIHDEVYFIKCATHDELGLQAGFTMQMEISKHEETEPLIPKPFATIGYPAYPPFPLFELTPVPQLGYRYGGNITAKVSLPNVGYRIHQTFVFDSDLPELMTYQFRDEYVMPETEGIFDALTGMDAEVKLEGFFQIGAKEELALKTNSVFSSIIYASTGVDIWVGPKLDGSLNIDAKSFWTTDDGPYLFRDSHIGFSVLSLDMEAYSAIDNILMDEPIHQTWVSTSIDLIDRLDLYAFPKFEEFDASYDESTHSIHTAWRAEPRCILWPCQPGIVMYKVVQGEANFLASDYDIAPKFGSTMKENFDVNFNIGELKTGWYKVAPSLLVSGTDFPVRSMVKDIRIPMTMQMDSTVLHFDAQGANKQSVHFITNCPPEGIGAYGDYYSQFIDYAKVDTIDLQKGEYKATFKAKPNHLLFGKAEMSATDMYSPGVFIVDQYLHDEHYHIGMKQDDADLSNVHVRVDGLFSYRMPIGEQTYTYTRSAGFEGKVNVIKSGNTIEMTGTKVETVGNEVYTSTLQMTLVQTVLDSATINLDRDQFLASGTITTKHTTNGTVDATTSITFSNVEGHGDNTSEAQAGCSNGVGGTITSGTWFNRYSDGTTSSGNMAVGLDDGLGIHIYVKSPGEQ